MRKRRRLTSSALGNGGLAASAVISLLGARPIGDGLGDDTDITDAGLAQSVYNAGEDAERNFFVAAEKNGVLRLLELRVDFSAELVNVDGIVAEINSLRFVDRDDEALLGDFLDRVRLGNVELDAGLEDGRGDHEDDQENEHDVDERHHVDLGERGLRRFGKRRHVRLKEVESRQFKVKSKTQLGGPIAPDWQAAELRACGERVMAKMADQIAPLAEGFFDLGRYFQCKRVEALG